jgi:hypothetical protein
MRGIGGPFGPAGAGPARSAVSGGFTGPAARIGYAGPTGMSACAVSHISTIPATSPPHARTTETSASRGIGACPVKYRCNVDRLYGTTL